MQKTNKGIINSLSGYRK